MDKEIKIPSNLLPPPKLKRVPRIKSKLEVPLNQSNVKTTEKLK